MLKILCLKNQNQKSMSRQTDSLAKGTNLTTLIEALHNGIESKEIET